MKLHVFFKLSTVITFLFLIGCGGSGGDSDSTDSSTSYYTISGTVSGLTGTGMVLQNNDSDSLSISDDGSFTFSSSVADGKSYSVAVSTQPSGQTCEVADGSGTINGDDVTGVSVTCDVSYTVGGTVSGLAGTGLVLQNNSGDDLTISADGSFTFSTGVYESSTYSVSVATQPSSLSQTCMVTNASGTMGTTNIINVSVDCTTNTYTIGGSVSGLNGSGLVLQNNGGDDKSISDDGDFTFTSAMTDGEAYAVTVSSQPGSPAQICSVSNGSGTLDGSDITNISISCANSHTVGGTISGVVSGSTVVLQNNGGDDLSLNSDRSFTFTTEVGEGSDYSVNVSVQPTDNDQYCNVVYGSDTMSTANVTDIEVVCVNGLYNVVDTNQTDCYESLSGDVRASCTGTGEDGEYSGTQPSYTSYTVVADEAVVLDDNTGLMWQASSDTDGVSGLNDDDKMTYSEGVTYCSGLDYGSYDDWRLPTIKELFSIYLMSGMDLSGAPGATTNGTYVDTSGIEPFIDTDYFDVGYGDISVNERVIDGQYLTETMNVSGAYSGFTYTMVDAFFGLNFVDGHLKAYEKDASDISDARYYVRCVRGNPYYGSNDFASTDSGATVTDNATNLMWQPSDSHATDFDDAISICEGATTAGYGDWRLPNLKELHSIVDYDNSPAATGNPAIDTTYFSSTSFTNEAGDNPDYAYYWSSTALLNYSGKGNSGAYITFGRGLGYINDTVVDVHGAGAQRSDGKKAVTLSGLTEIDVSGVSCTFGDTAYSSGPQGDIRRVVNNYVRCVRDK